MPDAGVRDHDRADRDFLSEAEEIFETLAANLRLLEVDGARGEWRPAVVNSIFRDVHTLKGLAGLQGLQTIADLAHDLEDLLQQTRMGGSAPVPSTLDLMQESFDGLTALVRSLGQTPSASGIEDLRHRLRQASSGAPPTAPGGTSGAVPGLDPVLSASLSQYEEHRLTEARRAGTPVILVRLRFDPEEFEARLREAVRRLEGKGEVICTVPVLGDGTDSRLAFTVVVASRAGAEPVAQVLQGFPAEIEAIGSDEGETRSILPVGDETSDDLRGVSDTLRVPIARLDDVLAQAGDLSRSISVVARSAQAASEARPENREMREIVRQIRALMPRLRALQRGAIEARLVPVEQIFGRIGRMVARAARAAGKHVDLHTLGGETELDKVMMDQLAGPLVHLLRNALDHGIETPEERERAGKPRAGRLVLSAFGRGRVAVIDVIDDGRGISTEAVRAAAEATGLIPAGRSISDQEARELIFATGFSTMRRVSQVSGRGVGLDVVRRTIKRLKGSIEVRSETGKGTTFTVIVPITLSLVQALIVRAGEERFAIPVLSIRENLRLESRRRRRVEAGETYEHPLGPLPLVSLDALMRPDAHRGMPGSERYAVIAGPPGRLVAIAVDGFLGQEEVVIKPVGRRLQDLPGLAGAADLGDARAVLVLDPEGLVTVGHHERLVD